MSKLLRGHHWPLSLSLVLVLFCTFLGDARSADLPQLRPYYVITLPAHIPITSEAIGDGLFAWSDQGTSTTLPSISLYDLHTRRLLRTLQPITQKGRAYSLGNLQVNSHWLVWVAVDMSKGLVWSTHALNLVSGKEILVDSSTQEGYPVNPRSSFSDGNISLGGDTVVWTTRHFVGTKVHSMVKVENLITQHTHILADLYENGHAGIYVWPATNGHYAAWVHILAGTKETDVLSLYDLRAHKPIVLPSHLLASMPTMDGSYHGSDYLAWKQGTTGGHGQGVVLYNLVTKAAQFFPGEDASLPQLGTDVLGYESADVGTIYLYDIRTHQHFMLEHKQLVLPKSGETFAQFSLGGRDCALSGTFPVKPTPQFALFHLSDEHPFYDLYH